MNKGIFIPESIMRLKNLSVSEKLLLAAIQYLSNSQACFASNAYFAKILGVTAKTASVMVQKLAAKNYIISTIEKQQGNRRYLLVNTTLINALAMDENMDSTPKSKDTYPENKGEPIPEMREYNKELKTINKFYKNGNKFNKKSNRFKLPEDQHYDDHF